MNESKNSLFDWCAYNAERGRQLRFEYKYIDDNGDPVDIRSIPYNSDQILTWKCINGHTWKDSVVNRTNGADCPECEKIYQEICKSEPKKTYGYYFNRTSGTSYPEQFLFYGLKQIYPNAKNRLKVFKDRYKYGLEYDIVIPSEDKNYRAVFIEYGSTYYHKNKAKRDELKEHACRMKDVRLIDIIDDTEKVMKQEIWYKDLVIFHMDYKDRRSCLVKILSHILKTLNHSISEINIEQAFKDAWTYSHGHIPFRDSIMFKYPELAKEWNIKINKREKPDKYTYGSQYSPSWVCPNCKRVFSASIGGRVHSKSGCRNCGFSWARLAKGEPQQIKPAYIRDLENSRLLEMRRNQYKF